MTATIVLDSISPEGIRLTTVHMRYWRAIHSELMTHRVFSRNARSSRAVPISKMIEEVRTDPFIPKHWGKNQKGMQAGEEHNSQVQLHWHYGPCSREEAWLEAKDWAIDFAEAFGDAGYHKQLVNRLLEPFMWIDTLVTSTDWANFFHLRNHGDAEPHFRDLAVEVREAMDGSTPTLLLPGQWHLPYVTDSERNFWDYDFAKDVARMVSAARCARISYKPFDGNGSILAEIERHDKLIGGDCVHASPLEHQATPDTISRVPFSDRTWTREELHGNFRGWIQYRKKVPNEAIHD